MLAKAIIIETISTTKSKNLNLGIGKTFDKTRILHSLTVSVSFPYPDSCSMALAPSSAATLTASFVFNYLKLLCPGGTTQSKQKPEEAGLPCTFKVTGNSLAS